MSLREIELSELSMDPIRLIGEEWMLITAGDEQRSNTMTASWGHMGNIWNKPTAVCFIRPQRYTKEFVDAQPYYSLSFFDPEYKKALGYLGSHSGRDGDKLSEVGMTTAYVDGVPYIAEAKLVLICRKLYRAPLVEEGFIAKGIIDVAYPDRDWHDMYIGEIVKALSR